MRHWINLFEHTSSLRSWVEKTMETSHSYDDDEILETGIGDLSEMMFDEFGNLFIHRQICFEDASEWINSISENTPLGIYWTFDAHMAQSYDADPRHRDRITITAKLAQEDQYEDQVEPYLRQHEAEVRLDKGTFVTVVRIFNHSERCEVRNDLEGKKFSA